VRDAVVSVKVLSGGGEAPSTQRVATGKGGKGGKGGKKKNKRKG